MRFFPFIDWNRNGKIDPVDVGVTVAAGREAAPETVALVGCAKQKRDHPCPARELYAPSTLFSLSYEYARRNADRVYIISAKYGLLTEDQVVAPYDETLNTMPAPARRAWADGVLAQLEAVCDLRRDSFILLAGKRYCEYLLPHLPHARLPLGNLPMGRRLEYLNAALSNEKHPVSPLPRWESPAARPPAPEFEAGDAVAHTLFGHGRVLKVIPTAFDAIVEVDFGDKGVRRLMRTVAARCMRREDGDS